MDIHAAVVSSFDQPPRYAPFDLPAPSDDGQAVVDVLAVGLHPRVRTGASGSHYTSTGKLPMVPGIDGVGRRADGRAVYFVADDDLVGPMATRTVIDTRRSVPLPQGTDVVKIAAAMNPAMSAWVALRRRVPIEAGQSVLVLGATGNAGRMAVQVAKRLGAGRVVGAGRDRDRLAALTGIGADATVALTDDADATAGALAEAACEVDLVIDYLWGRPAGEAIMALLRARADRGRALNWIQIGSMAGPTLELPSVALRSANLRIQGNGQGAVSTRTYLEELPALVEEIQNGGLSVSARPVPLADVGTAWTAPEVPGVRTVLVPAPKES
ncbi:zinc-binding alcohol dehydrogenase family protein [Streptomyces sp. NPDC005423]|uniref:quinone oxidoreductase family protein n=1 Tax=Streptomyces sp. NPDC005423 TaxID=3155343 RepID=UPI0033A1224A